MKQKAYSPGWLSAGADRVRILALVAGIGLLVAGLPAEAAGDGEAVELSFSIPEGTAAVAGVSLAPDGVTVRLPPGGGVPEDIVAAGGGLVRSGRLTHEPDGSLRYEIRLAGGVLEQVLFLPGHLVLRLRAHASAVSPGTATHQYRLGIDDRIQISVEGQPDLLSTVVVKGSGMVTAPLVGEVLAAGRPVQEIAAEIAGKLGAEFLVDPQVDVQVTEYNSQWVLVTGQVARPGRVMLRGGTTLKEIIAEAGGLTALAGSRILVADSPTGSGGGGGSLEVDRREFEAGKTHIVPRHGSIINVEKIAYAYIQGEILKSGTVMLEPGMTLLKAIAVSGGLTEWADRKEIRILDSEAGTRAKVYNLKRIQAQKDPDPLIEEGQMIIIPRRFL